GVVRTPVGQAYVSEAMIENRAVVGGEGSGGVIVPRVQLTNDSAAAAGLILEHMATAGQKISELAEGLPRLAMIKHNVAVEPNRIYSLVQRVYDELEREGVEYDQTDGIKIARAGGRVHLRVLDTEAVIRVLAEAETDPGAPGLGDY